MDQSSMVTFQYRLPLKKALVSAEKELILINIDIQLPEKKITWEKSLP